MPACELYVTYQNHQICVVRTKGETARLYVDHELLDSNNDLYTSEDGPTLMGVFGANDAHIEVFIKPATTEQLAIRVNGVWISGSQLTPWFLTSSVLFFATRLMHLASRENSIFQGANC